MTTLKQTEKELLQLKEDVDGMWHLLLSLPDTCKQAYLSVSPWRSRGVIST